MRIKKLPTFIANQIAAGEVVERPASVLKELLENSVDAKSTDIQVEISKGGINSITITDDGIGIYKDDLELACAQHATSKVSTAKDLEAITSLGFRGEALASIASVSKFELISKPAIQDMAWKIILSGNDFPPAIEPCVHANGTTTIMRELFFNTPARRHFLRTERTEYYYTEEVFKRIALCNFDIAFSLTHNNKKIYKLPKASSKEEKIQRVSKIFGRSFITKSIYIEAKQDGLELHGWMILPTHAKTQAINQYFYINNRIIKDKLINHAIKQVYHQLCEPGKNPNYCLFLSLNPNEIDVNVHPTKHEVRFKKARYVHQFIIDSLFEALSKAINNSDMNYVTSDSPKYDNSKFEHMNLDFSMLSPQTLYAEYSDSNLMQKNETIVKNNVNILGTMNVNAATSSHKNNNSNNNNALFNNLCEDEIDNAKKHIDFRENINFKINAKGSKIQAIKSETQSDSSNNIDIFDCIVEETSQKTKTLIHNKQTCSNIDLFQSNNNKTYLDIELSQMDNKKAYSGAEFSQSNVVQKEIILIHVLEQKIALVLLEGNLMFINLVDSIKQIVFKELKEEYMTNSKIKCSPLLLPETIDIKPNCIVVDDIIMFLLDFGFDIESLPGNNLLIRALPYALIKYRVNLKEFVPNLLKFAIKLEKNIKNKNNQIKTKDNPNIVRIKDTITITRENQIKTKNKVNLELEKNKKNTEQDYKCKIDMIDFISNHVMEQCDISDAQALAIVKKVILLQNDKSANCNFLNIKKYITAKDLVKVIKQKV